MGKKSNKELRKANGYSYTGEDSLDKLREELIQPNREKAIVYKPVRQFGNRKN